MALNKKIRDELNAAKGLTSSSVYDEEDQKKKKAAQEKARAEAAKKAAQNTKKAGSQMGAGLKAGSTTASGSTRPTPRSQQKQDESEFFKNLRQTLQGRLKEYRQTRPAASDLGDRYSAPNAEQETDVAGRRKDYLTGNVYNAQLGLDINTDSVYDARKTVQDLKGLSAGTKNNARYAANWEDEALSMGNRILGGWYGNAKETLDRLAGQLDDTVSALYSPENRQKEAEKEKKQGTLAAEAPSQKPVGLHGTGVRFRGHELEWEKRACLFFTEQVQG